MREGLTLLVLVLGTVVAFLAWQRIRVRRRSEERLLQAPVPVEERKEQPFRARPFLRRHRLLPWMVGAVVAGCLYFYFQHLPLALAAGGLVGLLGGQLEAYLANRAAFLIEVQLGDAIDLMVAALQVGVGVLNALESAVTEIRPPLRPQLEEVLGRIRYGNEPRAVLRDLDRRVPLESFRLFATALSVHWRTGGNLTPILGTVARAVRDRVDVSRRIESLTADARISTVVILCVTYFIAFVIWYSEPEAMVDFLATYLGKSLLAAAIFMQGVGIAWSASMSRLRY
jgi:tight adherence protein B